MLYVKHNPNKLLQYLQHGTYPIDADKICAENKLFIEQAYILLDKGDEKKAFDVLDRVSNEGEV